MGVEDYNKKKLERLREHKIAFDQEAMWAAMQKKKKKRGAFFFFTMALVALAIVFFAYLHFFTKGESGNTKLDNTDRIELSDKTNIDLGDGKIINLEDDVDAEVNADTRRSADLSNIDEANEKNQSNLINNDQNSKNRTSPINQKNSASSRQEIKRQLSSNYDSNTKNNAPESVNRSTNTKHSNNQEITFETKSKSTGTVLNNQSKINTINQVSRSEERNNKLENIKLERLINIQPLKIYEFPYLESLKNISIDLNDLEVTPPTITDVIKSPKSRFHISVYGGVGYLLRQSSLLEQAIFEPNNETLEEVSVGLELKYQLSPSFFVRAGVEYWQATERKEETSYSIQNIKDLEIPPTGFTEGDNGIIITTGYSKIHTIYQSYNIPILLGWNTNNNRWNIFAEAGFLYNFKAERKRNEESFVATEEEIYTIGTRSQISPLAGIGLSFSLTNRYEIFVRANWRGSQFVTIEETRESLKFGAIRTQLGVRIGF